MGGPYNSIVLFCIWYNSGQSRLCVGVGRDGRQCAWIQMKGGGRERNKAKSHPGGFCLIWHYRSLDRFRTATVPLAIEQFQCATVQQWQYQILCHRQQQSLTPYDTEAAIIGFHCTFALVTIESLFVSERQCAILLRICDRPVHTLKPDYWLVENTIFTLWLWQTVVDSLLTVRDVFFDISKVLMVLTLAVQYWVYKDAILLLSDISYHLSDHKSLNWSFLPIIWRRRGNLLYHFLGSCLANMLVSLSSDHTHLMQPEHHH